MLRARRDPPDGIEMLPPNEHAFGAAEGITTFAGVDDQAASGFDDAPRSSRPTQVLAGLLLAGLAAVAAVAVATSGDGQSSAPSTTGPTTTGPTTTGPAVTAPGATATPPPGGDDPPPTGADLSPAYLLADPGSLDLTQVWGTSPAGPTTANADSFVLWSTPGATRTSGRWLAATTLRVAGAAGQVERDGIRLRAGRDVGVLTADPDGVARLRFTSIDGTDMEIGGLGIGLPDLLAIAAEIRSDGDGIDTGDTARRVRTGMAAVSSVGVPIGGLGPLEHLSMWGGATYRDGAQALVLGTGSSTTNLQVLQFLMMAPPSLTDADRRALAALERRFGAVEIGVDPSQPEVMVAIPSWPSRRLVVMRTFGVPVSALIQQLGGLRLPSDEEWADLVERSDRGELGPASAAAPPTIFGGGVTADARWQTGISSDAAIVYLVTDRAFWAGARGDVTAPSVLRLASTEQSFIIGLADAAGPARQMRVTVAGHDAVIVPMRPADPSTFGAAFGYADIADATVDFLDADGNVVS